MSRRRTVAGRLELLDVAHLRIAITACAPLMAIVIRNVALSQPRRSRLTNGRTAGASACPQEARDHHAIQVMDTATGKGRLVARLPFNIAFRASWVDDDTAVIVNRQDTVSHIVLFDSFLVDRTRGVKPQKHSRSTPGHGPNGW